MKTTWIRWLLILATLFVLAACSSEPTAPPTPPTATVPPAKAGWQRHTIASENVTLDLPEGWVAFDFSGPDKADVLARGRQDHPELAQVLPDRINPLENQGIIFAAFNPAVAADQQGVIPNISVIRHKGAGMENLSLKALAQTFQQQLANAGSVLIPGAEILTLPSGEAARYEYYYKGKNPAGEELVLQGEQYVWRTNEAVYGLLATGFADKFTDLQPTTRSVAESLSLSSS
jgi:hypothetical protein